MAVVTIEQRILEQHGCSVIDLLRTYIVEGRTSKQIAQDLGCSISNVRRLARKYKVRFHLPVIRPQMIQNPQFLSSSINTVNFLSRSWHNKGRAIIPAYVDSMITAGYGNARA